MGGLLLVGVLLILVLIKLFGARVLGGAILGLILGAVIGILLRPSIPLVGKLPLGHVVTRGQYLTGVDVLFRQPAEDAFDRMLVAALIGAVVIGGSASLGGRNNNIGSKLSQKHVVTYHVNRPPSTPASQSPQKFCTSCGSTLASEDSFCGGCGSRRAQQSNQSVITS